jgi:hypothetical protein
MAKISPLAKIESKAQLLELQRYFAKMIRRPLIDYSKMLRDKDIGNMIKSNDRSNPHQRLQFYAQQYWWRIIDALDEDFPTVQKLLSPNVYKKLRLSYLEKCPSMSFTLRNLGSRFPQFIQKNPRLTKSNSPLITAAARFDWEIVETFDAGEAKPLSVDMLSDPKFPSKKLYLQPHVRLLELSYPVQTTFKLGAESNRESASNTLTAGVKKSALRKVPKISRKKTFLAIHRFQNRPHIKELTANNYLILCAIKQGCSLKGLIKITSNLKKISDSELHRGFSEWMALGWLHLDKTYKK